MRDYLREKEREMCVREKYLMQSLDRRTQWKRYQRSYHRFSDDNYIINLLYIIEGEMCRFVNDTLAVNRFVLFGVSFTDNSYYRVRLKYLFIPIYYK